jgi:hypothetical protein
MGRALTACSCSGVASGARAASGLRRASRRAFRACFLSPFSPLAPGDTHDNPVTPGRACRLGIRGRLGHWRRAATTTVAPLCCLSSTNCIMSERDYQVQSSHLRRRAPPWPAPGLPRPDLRIWSGPCAACRPCRAAPAAHGRYTEEGDNKVPTRLLHQDTQLCTCV